MDYGFIFSEKSKGRNAITSRYEPIQPLLLYEFASLIGAVRFFDIGANIGYYSLVATLIPGMTSVYAFEASKETFDELKRNVELNGFKGTIFPEQKAVSSQDGEVSFQIRSGLSGINGVAETSFHNAELFTETVTVECVALDSYSDVSGEALAVKVDVEGHEVHVIRGAEKLLTNNNCVLQVEAYGEIGGELTSLLSNMGYSKIFSVKADHYYSNVRILDDTGKVVECVERSAARLVDLHLGIWPHNKTRDPLDLSGKLRGGLVEVKCNLNDNIFDDEPEYAYYIYCDNEKIDMIWYTSNARFNYKLPEKFKGGSISVTAFVREKSDPEKKVRKSIALGTWS